MVLRRHTRFLQLLRVNEVRPIKPPIDEGSSIIAVKSKLSIFRPLTFPRFSGKFSKFELPERSRHSSDFKQQMVLERHTRFLQLLRVNEVRPIKPPIDEGNSSIAVSLKSSLPRRSIIHGFSGKFLNLEHVERSRAP
ncbi:hypothetical protein RGQ29_024503 [Quercus rubra]|uniref:Uncharacterized protein n=1 Tax=Quercus rubra TaxID=3512 RepID=A0AAN7EVL9_QUERU|nr:hypothetical protein RGQ29_024503 [Quercus rubra]